jgi:hypothetical protein
MEKKKRDYIFMLVFMVLSFICLGPLSKLYGVGNRAVETLTGVILISWYIFCYRVTSNFSVRWVKVSYAFLLLFQLSFITYVHMQDQKAISEQVISATIAYCANLVGFSLVFYIMLRDIFSQKHDLTYSLLGASNIYLMIPVLFSYLFSTVAVRHPEWVHADYFSIKTVLANCFEYSYYVMAGMDYPGEKIGEAIQSIGIFEAISGNLFIVFVIGRLMMK